MGEKLQLIRNKSPKKCAVHGKYGSQTILIRGVELFSKATWLPLTEQTRSKDEDHTSIIKHIGCGKQITMVQLRQYKPLKPEDLASRKWRYAPILVSTNRERFDITEVQAKSFANESGTVILRWKKKIRERNIAIKNEINGLPIKLSHVVAVSGKCNILAKEASEINKIGNNMGINAIQAEGKFF